MTLVTKYQISAINSYREKCDEKYLGRTDRGKTVYPTPSSGSGGIKIEECHERSIMAFLKLLLNEKRGLSALYPNNIIHLMRTAEVERVFSQVKLVKIDHINCMKQVTMNNILHVKLNCNKQCCEHVSDTVVDKFFRVNDRKIEFYLG